MMYGVMVYDVCGNVLGVMVYDVCGNGLRGIDNRITFYDMTRKCFMVCGQCNVL